MAYTYGFNDLVARMNRQEAYVEYFQKHVAPGRNFITVMSIGPGECGTEILLISSALSDIKQLHLVEPDETLNTKGTEKIKQAFGEKFELLVFNKRIEDHIHNSHKLDLILINNVLYHQEVLDNFSPIMAKIKNWLSEDGIIVISHTFCPFYLRLHSMSLNNHKDVDPEKLAKLVSKHGLKTACGWTDYTLDTTDSESTNYAWLALLVARSVTSEDIADVKDIVKDLTTTDSGLVPMKQYIMVASQAQ